MPESPEAFEALEGGPEGVEVFVASGYGAMTQRPFVSLSVGDTRVQMSPDAARGIGMDLLAAAEGSLTDAFLAEFFTDHMGQPREVVASVLQMRRDYRAKTENEESEGPQ